MVFCPLVYLGDLGECVGGIYYQVGFLLCCKPYFNWCPIQAATVEILGFGVMAGVTFVLQLSDGVGIVRSAVVFVGVAILYGVLQTGGDKKAWNYLR